MVSFLKMIVHILSYSLSKSVAFFNFENVLKDVFLINRNFRILEILEILNNNICYKVYNNTYTLIFAYFLISIHV